MIEQRERRRCEFCLDEPSKSNHGRIVITMDAKIGSKTYNCRYCGATEVFVNGVRKGRSATEVFK